MLGSKIKPLASGAFAFGVRAVAHARSVTVRYELGREEYAVKMCFPDEKAALRALGDTDVANALYFGARVTGADVNFQIPKGASLSRVGRLSHAFGFEVVALGSLCDDAETTGAIAQLKNPSVVPQ